MVENSTLSQQIADVGTKKERKQRKEGRERYGRLDLEHPYLTSNQKIKVSIPPLDLATTSKRQPICASFTERHISYEKAKYTLNQTNMANPHPIFQIENSFYKNTPSGPVHTCVAFCDGVPHLPNYIYFKRLAPKKIKLFSEVFGSPHR